MKPLILIPLLLLLGCREPKQKEIIISDSDTDGIKGYIKIDTPLFTGPDRSPQWLGALTTSHSRSIWIDTSDICELDTLDNGDIERSAK